ncbi:MAG: hypothetical protein IJI22_04645 [Bacilli bacterium]|nr:hypothetical protein [Bacilli bacterium]
MKYFKYIKFSLCLLLICFMLTGCSLFGKKLTEEEKICQAIAPSIEKYQNKEINYNEFLDSIKGDYESSCSNETTSVICVAIKGLYATEDTDLELKDCSNLSGNFKDLCESTNKAKKSMSEKKDDIQDASVNNLKRSCDLLAEK